MNEFEQPEEMKNNSVDENNNVSDNNSGQDNQFVNMSTNDYLSHIANRNDNSNYYYDTRYNSGNKSNNYQSYDNNLYFDENEKKKKKVKKIKNKKSKTLLLLKKTTAIAASAAIFGGVSGGVFYLINGNELKEYNKNASNNKITIGTYDLVNDNTTENGSIISANNNSADMSNMSVSELAQNVMPSVVSVSITATVKYNQWFFGSYEYESEGSGSGIIIGKNNEELLMVTNNHVVKDANTVSVKFIDDEVYDAQVKGTDSDNDLAIIVVKLSDLSEDTLSKIKVARVGSSDALQVGEQVVAIGNALGYGQSVTTGIVSALDRVVDTNVTPLIQTDAAINPGNSGGAMFNMRGEVVGINSSKYASTDVEGMGYAIPISQVQNIIDDLMNRETRQKVDADKVGYMGIGCENIDDQVKSIYNIPGGVLITEVAEGSAAEAAGIKKNSIITKFDGQTIKNYDELINLLQYYEAGETVDVTIQKLVDGDFQEEVLSVKLGKKK